MNSGKATGSRPSCSQTDDVVRASFYEAPRFKANSTLHEQTAERAGLAFVTQGAARAALPPLNTGRAQGRLRIIKSVEQTGDLSPQDILVLDEVPVWLPPVAGLVTQRPSTLLSHVNLLARAGASPTPMCATRRRRCANTTASGWS